MKLLELFRLDERYQDIVAALKPYSQRADIFITFSDIEKVGVHPSSKHDTPIGIYTYPIREMWESIVNDTVPFASERNYVHVLQAAVPVLELSEYTDGDWARDEDKLRSIVGPWVHDHYEGRVHRVKYEKILKDLQWDDDAYAAARDNNFADQHDAVEVTEDETWAMFMAACESDANHYRHATNQAAMLFWAATRFAAMLYARARGPDSKVSVVWNAIFRAIGYPAISDRAAQGIIHSNEPCQAVFFRKDAVRHISTLHNVRKPMGDDWLDGRKWEFDSFWNFVYNLDDPEQGKDKGHRFYTAMLRSEWLDLFLTGETPHFKIDRDKFFDDANNDHHGMSGFVGHVISWGGLRSVFELHKRMPELFDTYVWKAIYQSISHGRLSRADLEFLLRPQVEALIAKGVGEESPEGFKINDASEVDMARQLFVWAVRQSGNGAWATIQTAAKRLRPVWDKIKDRLSEEEMHQIIEQEWPF